MLKKNAKNVIFSIVFGLILIVTTSSALLLSKNRLNDIHYISSEEGLKSIENDLSGHYIIDADTPIVLSSNWVPIGDLDRPFTGILDCNYNSIVGKGFDESYALGEIEKKSEVFLGLFARNEGVIKHLSISFSRLFDETLFDYDIDKDYEVTFGSVCAVNDGYISMCTVPQTPGTLNMEKCRQLVFGGITGINNKQVRCARLENGIIISLSNNIICGGFIGINKNGAIAEYCTRKGYSWITSLTGDVVCGQAIGICYGGNINNISITSPEVDETYRTCHYFKLKSGCCGGLIGVLKADDISISCINIYTSFEIREADTLKFGFVIGSNDSSLKTNIQGVVISGDLINNSGNDLDLCYICFTNNNINVSDVYTYKVHTTANLSQKELIENKLFEELSTSMVGFDGSCWSKCDFSFILDF